MRMAGLVQYICPCGIQKTSDSMDENGWLRPMYVSKWDTKLRALNEYEWLFRSNVYVQLEHRRNPTQWLRMAG